MDDKTRFRLIVGTAVVFALYVLFILFVAVFMPEQTATYQQYQRQAQKQYDPLSFVLFIGDSIAAVWHLIGRGHDVLLVLFTSGIFVVTYALAKYTKELWGATSKLVTDTVDIARIQFRAYVAIPADGIAPSDMNGAADAPRLRLSNFGKTAAYRTCVKAGIFSNVASIDPKAMEPILDGHILSPDNHVALNFPIGKPRIPDSSKDSFCLSGEIEYTDVYGIRWLHCFQWAWGHHGERKHNFMPIPGGNYEKSLGKDPQA